MNGVLSLDQLFHKRVFHVPDYQRGYAWESQQIQEFLEDLEILTHGRYHFTGLVVLHEAGNQAPRMDSDGNTYAIVDIVDGQQRITTIVLLLDAIRRALLQFGETATALASGIGKNYVAATEINGQPLYKLMLNSDCDHFFKNSVLRELPGIEGPQITSEQRLTDAKEQIAKYIRSTAGNGRESQENWLRQLYEKVVTQLQFSLYEVDSAAEVGVIFELMNNRGKQLSELEKVKNYLLYAGTSLGVKNELAATVNDAWSEILRQLMGADLVRPQDEDRLLRAHWLTQYDWQPRKWNGSKSVKEQFDLRKFRDDYSGLLDQLHEYVEGLRSASIGVCDAYKPERPDAFKSYDANPKLRLEVISWSSKLTHIGVVATFLPVLLAIRHRWPGSPDKYLEMLKLCEAYAFRVYRLRGSRADAGLSTLCYAGYSLYHDEWSFEEVCRWIKSDLRDRCDDGVFASYWKGEPDDEWYNWRGLKYLLYEYEIHLASSKGASPNVQWADVWKPELKDTIEHVLPQTVDNVPYWRKRFRSRVHRDYVHDIGNLSLTKHNSYYSNNPFPEKRGSLAEKSPCYVTSPFYMERELADWEDWNAEAINESRARLAEWATTRWAVDWSDLGEEDKVETVDDEIEEDDLPFDDGEE